MKHTEQLEVDRVREVAQEYRKRGYRVWERPHSSELPGNLRPFQLDIMATSEADSVVIEVRNRRSLSNDKRLAEIAEAVKQMQGWRFELVVTNPKFASEERVGINPTDVDISNRLAQVRQLIAQNFTEPAFMAAWAVTEAILRETAFRAGVELPGVLPALVLKTLRSEGILSKANYDKLDGAMRLRNSVAHGFSPIEDPLPHLRDMLEIAEELRRYRRQTPSSAS
jgi:hypothetical protein